MTSPDFPALPKDRDPSGVFPGITDRMGAFPATRSNIVDGHVVESSTTQATITSKVRMSPLKDNSNVRYLRGTPVFCYSDQLGHIGSSNRWTLLALPNLNEYMFLTAKRDWEERMGTIMPRSRKEWREEFGGFLFDIRKHLKPLGAAYSNEEHDKVRIREITLQKGGEIAVVPNYWGLKNAECQNVGFGIKWVKAARVMLSDGSIIKNTPTEYFPRIIPMIETGDRMLMTGGDVQFPTAKRPTWAGLHGDQLRDTSELAKYGQKYATPDFWYRWTREIAHERVVREVHPVTKKEFTYKKVEECYYMRYGKVTFMDKPYTGNYPNSVEPGNPLVDAVLSWSGEILAAKNSTLKIQLSKDPCYGWQK